MTHTPLFAETPRRRPAVLLATSSLGLLVATAICLLLQASVAVILALPLLAVVCLCIAIQLSPATRYEVGGRPGDSRPTEWWAARA